MSFVKVIGHMEKKEREKSNKNVHCCMSSNLYKASENPQITHLQ